MRFKTITAKGFYSDLQTLLTHCNRKGVTVNASDVIQNIGDCKNEEDLDENVEVELNQWLDIIKKFPAFSKCTAPFSFVDGDTGVENGRSNVFVMGFSAWTEIEKAPYTLPMLEDSSDIIPADAVGYLPGLKVMMKEFLYDSRMVIHSKMFVSQERPIYEVQKEFDSPSYEEKELTLIKIKFIIENGKVEFMVKQKEKRLKHI